jgi:Camelysin metallo-endopeptidase
MDPTAPPQGRRRRLRLILASLLGLAALAATGAAVLAGLTANAASTESVTSGTLSLTVPAGSGSVGFNDNVTNMAPGDVSNVYVDLTNGGSLDGNGITLGVSGTGTSLLTTSTSDGLAVAVTQCSVAWTASTGTCSGTTSPLVASTAVATLSSTPATVVSGDVPAGTVDHLQVSLSLPDQDETTVNGTYPDPTIQGQNTTLTYTFSEDQRPPITTNS